MKKNLLLLLFLLAACGSYGQSFMHFGLFGNGGGSWIQGSTSYFNADLKQPAVANPANLIQNMEIKTKQTYSYGGGFTVGLNFIQYLGIQTGVNYQIQGQKINYFYSTKNAANPAIIDEQIEGDINNQYAYVKLPFLLRINSSPNKSAMFTLLLGGQMGWVTSAMQDANGTYESPTSVYRTLGVNSSTVFGFREKYQRPLFEGVAEMGVDFWAGPLVIALHLRGEYAFRDVVEQRSTTEALRNITGGVVLGVSYFLPFNDKVEFKHTRRWY